MSKAWDAACVQKKKLWGKDLDWCFDFENKLETIKILNIVGAALTDKGRQHKKELEQYIQANSDKYFELTS